MTEQPSNVRRVPVVARDGAAAPPTAPPRRGPRRSIISTADYATAERIVDVLSDRGFPVERVAIIGHDMQLVEQVTGRMTYGRAAWRGALSGALPGVLIGWIFGLFSWVDPLIAGLVLALYGLVIGAILGAIAGLIIHAMQGGRRDFASVAVMRPQRYEVIVDDEVADEALRLLDKEI